MADRRKFLKNEDFSIVSLFFRLRRNKSIVIVEIYTCGIFLGFRSRALSLYLNSGVILYENKTNLGLE